MAREPEHPVTGLPGWARRGRSGWRFDGRVRPDFALEPGPGQESVWDYPRPPRLERDLRHVVVRSGDVTIAETRRALRVLETASPPTVYLPPGDVRTDLLRPEGGVSRCEWKGQASYWSVILPDRVLESVGWSYPEPFSEFAELAHHLSFYPARLECYIDGERVRPQPGGFYGGWLTSEIVGPVKGEPGTGAW